MTKREMINLMKLVNIYVEPITEWIDNCIWILGKIGVDVKPDDYQHSDYRAFWDKVDELLSECVQTWDDDISNSILWALLSATESMIKWKCGDNVETEHYINGEDTHLLIDGEYWNCVDFEELVTANADLD
jgi:hypothetical protein